MRIATGAAGLRLGSLAISHRVWHVVAHLRDRHWRAAFFIWIFGAPALLIGIVARLRRLCGFGIGRWFVRRLIGCEVFGLDLRLCLREFVLELDAIGGAFVLAALLAVHVLIISAGAFALA